MFTVPIEPVAQGRARVTVVGGHARLYTPAKTRRFHEDIAQYAKGALGVARFCCPLRVDVLAVLRRPKRLQRKKDEGGIIWNDGTRPDTDNIRKAVLDGLSAHFDDKFVVAGDTLKTYGDKKKEGHLIIRITDKVGEVEQWCAAYFGEEENDEPRR